MPRQLPFLLIAAIATAASSAAAAQGGCTGVPSRTRLYVDVDNVRDARGLIAVTLYSDDRSKFLARGGSLHVGRVPARRGRTRVCIHVPAPGTYALAVYHDANGDRRFNRTPLGLPGEGFGFSNNPPNLLGLPDFEKVKLRVAKSGQSTIVRLLYR